MKKSSSVLEREEINNKYLQEKDEIKRRLIPLVKMKFSLIEATAEAPGLYARLER